MSRMLIQGTHLCLSFHSFTLFDDISFSIHQKEVFALIGENGCGKSSLLKLLIGSLLPDAGRLQRAEHLSIGYLPQDIDLNQPMPARDYLCQHSLLQIEEQMAQALEDPSQLEKWEALHEEYERLGGYRKLPIEKILVGLKLTEDYLDVPIKHLSSGQRVRIELAKALMKNPDLLLLDEPTNHLDPEMRQWLKGFLRERIGATVVVSHDREFLSETCNRLMELHESKLSSYTGSYDFYLKERQDRLQKQINAYEQWKQECLRLKQKIKAATFSKSKPSAPKDRNIMAYDRRGEQYQQSAAHHLNELKGALDRLESNPVTHPKPKAIKGLYFHDVFLETPLAIELDSVGKRWNNQLVFSGICHTLLRGDRVVLLGANGKGKTTLLKCMAGLITPDEGSIHYGASLKIGYLDQEVDLLKKEDSALEYFYKKFGLKEDQLRSELYKLALGGFDFIKRPMISLSTGQRKRLMLLSLVLERPNVLLLDEPTNHLDFLTLEALEKALLNFKGAILAVSHDPTFIRKLQAQKWYL